MPIVYIAINKINGKRYIGASRHTIEKRRAEHLRDAKNNGFCRVFYAAIRKYGEDAFEWKVLSEKNSIEEIMIEEIRLIYDLKPEYNITKGGQGIIGVPRTVEWNEKISRALKGKKLTIQRKEKCIAGLNKARAKRFRSVVCLNDGLFFSRVIDAAKYYGLSNKGIRDSATGVQTHTGNLSFIYSKTKIGNYEIDELLSGLRIRRELADKLLRLGSRSKSITCSDGQSFKSAVEAAKYYKISSGLISRLCTRGGATQLGLKFRFTDKVQVERQPRTKEQVTISNLARLNGSKKANQKVRKQVICKDNNMLYASITDAANSNGVHVSALSAAIHRNGKSGGKSFCFLDEWCPNPL